MKPTLFFAFAFAIASANVNAANMPVPAETSEQFVGTVPDRLPPMIAPVPVIPPAAVPAMPVPINDQGNNDELMNLIRAQTDAIRSLSTKIDSLEQRVGKIETGRR